MDRKELKARLDKATVDQHRLNEFSAKIQQEYPKDKKPTKFQISHFREQEIYAEVVKAHQESSQVIAMFLTNWPNTYLPKELESLMKCLIENMEQAKCDFDSAMKTEIHSDHIGMHSKKTYII